jgi:hypothetical protein
MDYSNGRKDANCSNDSSSIVKNVQIYFKPKYPLKTISIFGNKFGDSAESQMPIREIILERFVYDQKRGGKKDVNLFIKNGGSACIQFTGDEYKALLRELFLNLKDVVDPVSMTVYDFARTDGKKSDSVEYGEKFFRQRDRILQRPKG